MGVSSALGSSALLPAGLGFRNLIINGGFDINQRGLSSGGTTSSTQYGFDRWAVAYAGGTTTYSAQTFAAGAGPAGDIEATNFCRVATTGQTSASHLVFLYQYIENVRLLAGKQVTVSFYARASSGTPKVAVELAQKFGTGGTVADTNTYAGQVTLSTSWARYSVTVFVPLTTGKTLGPANTSSTVLSLWTSAGSDYNSRTGSLGLQNATIDFWGVQVEANYKPTPFEHRPYGVELALCQRYYMAWSAINTSGRIAMGIGKSTTAADFLLPYKVQPRITLGTLSVTGNYGASDTAAYQTGTGMTRFDITCSDTYYCVSVTAASGIVQYRPYFLESNAGNLVVAANMEL